MASTSFHLSGEAQSEALKTMTTSVDRLFGDMAIDSFHQTMSVEKPPVLPHSQVPNTREPHLKSVPPQAPPKPGQTTSVNPSQIQSRHSQGPNQPNAMNRQSSENEFGKGSGVDGEKAKFLAVTLLEDVQAVRCAEFHPAGRVFAIGSNSKTLRLCAYPNLSKLDPNHVAYQPTILYKRTKHHKVNLNLENVARQTCLELLVFFYSGFHILYGLVS